MKYILFVIDSVARSPHSVEEMEAIDALNDEMEQAGHRLFACGLEHPSQSTIWDFRNETENVDVASLMGVQKFYSGFWIIDVPDEEKARYYARKGSKACQREIELRPMIG
jgi:hypothetical protein